jgi:hypothetical protein
VVFTDHKNEGSDSHDESKETIEEGTCHLQSDPPSPRRNRHAEKGSLLRPIRKSLARLEMKSIG